MGSYEKKLILERLAQSVLFEDFLNRKFTATKRFGLDGGWSLVPGMRSMIDRAGDLGVEEIEIAMAHRGRLNVLANVLGKPLEQMLSEFTEGVKPASGEGEEEVYTGSGDVKYHLGTSTLGFETVSGVPMRLSLLSNPSHLEAVAPVAVGKTRAKQHYNKDYDRSKTMCVLLHGDGSHSGQGVVYETYDMSGLPDYTVGGTIHIIVNNQVAYTTDPKYSRSSPYCTDVAIDLICYRKHGHNEGDEPSFTHPVMYERIAKLPNTLEIYSKQLVEEGVLTKKEIEEVKNSYLKKMAESLEAAKDYELKDVHWLESVWTGFKSPLHLGL